MRPFRQVSCTSEILKVFYRNHPAFYHGVRFEIEDRLPLAKFTLYSYSTSNATYWFGFKGNAAITSEIYICHQGSFSNDDVVAGFEYFDKTVGITASQLSFYIIADMCFTDALLPYLEKVNWGTKEYPSYSYFMTPEQEELLMSTKVQELPEGYTFEDASVEDAELMTSTWKYSEKNELAQTRMKITALPSSRVRFQNQTIGFEMVDPNGTLNHLLVLKTHRGKGLGLIIHLETMKKCIREGLNVTKLVEPSNPTVVEASDRSPFWTKERNPDGSPLIRMYLGIWPKGTVFGNGSVNY